MERRLITAQQQRSSPSQDPAVAAPVAPNSEVRPVHDMRDELAASLSSENEQELQQLASYTKA